MFFFQVSTALVQPAGNAIIYRLTIIFGLSQITDAVVTLTLQIQYILVQPLPCGIYRFFYRQKKKVGLM